MNTKAIILTGITAMLYVKGLSQINYGIAALDRSDITCTNLAATDKSPQIPVYETVQTETTVEMPVQDNMKRKKKSKKKKVKTKSVSQIIVSAKKTNAFYDPNEVLHNGFTVTAWVLPQVTLVEKHGYLLYPLNGYDTNGIMQSQWGITVDKQYVRIYERYQEERLLLEYKHNEDKDFFIAFTCQNSTPALYINGELVSTGVRSEYQPHPAFEGVAQCPEIKRFVGKSTRLQYFQRVLTSNDIRGLYKTEYALLHKTSD